MGVKIGVSRDKMESMEMQNKSTILVMVAVDRSKFSIHALLWALNKLLTSQDRIILIHAQGTSTSYMTTGKWSQL